MEGLEKRKADLPIPESVNELGLTELEQNCMDGLNQCMAAFWEMDRQHPDEARDFVNAVHVIQRLLGQRIVRRCYPKGWPTYRYRKDVKVCPN